MPYTLMSVSISVNLLDFSLMFDDLGNGQYQGIFFTIANYPSVR